MTITKKQDGTALEIALEGRLDTMTAPMLNKELRDSLNGITKLTLDFEGLEYISSAGLRVLLAAQSAMDRQGEMKVLHVNDTIQEIFEMTGFAAVLTIE